MLLLVHQRCLLEISCGFSKTSFTATASNPVPRRNPSQGYIYLQVQEFRLAKMTSLDVKKVLPALPVAGGLSMTVSRVKLASRWWGVDDKLGAGRMKGGQ